MDDIVIIEFRNTGDEDARREYPLRVSGITEVGCVDIEQAVKWIKDNYPNKRIVIDLPVLQALKYHYPKEFWA